MNLTWAEWLEVLDDITDTWPQTKTTTLARDAAGDFVDMDTIRAWHKLVADHPQDVVFGAVFRYATTDPKNEWPPQGPTIARLCREIAAENFAMAQRTAPALPTRTETPVDGRTFAQRQGFANLREYAKSRCKSQRHYNLGTDETCRMCNNLPPLADVLAQTAAGR